jgi:predicted Zn finger-like uncharacterized protein
MIAACPKCQTRYRVETEKLGPEGARLRCSQCSAVFRVRLPDATPSSVPVVPVVEAPTPAASRSLEAPSAQAPSSTTNPASAGAFGAGARSEPQASEAHQVRVPAGNQPRSAEGRPVARTSDSLGGDAPHFDRDRLVLVAHPNTDACKRIAEALEAEGVQVLVAHDGVEAILSIQRAQPRAVVLDAALPKMFGFQVCELVKRNESLRVIHVCLMGAIHKEDRYRRAPNEIYGADFYCEPPAVPGALIDWLGRMGLPLRSRGSRPTPPNDTSALEAPSDEIALEAPSSQVPRSVTNLASAGASSAGARSEAKSAEPSEAHKARVPEGIQPRSAEGRSVTPAAAPAAPAAPAKLTIGRVGAPADPLTAERAQAERLARIIVSDIVLYNEEKFTAAIRSGNALEALSNELEEGRALFRERIDARIREERDFLADELARVARTRGMA